MGVGIGPIVVVVAFLVMMMAVPAWPWMRPYGYRPTIVLGVVFLLVTMFVVFNA